MRTTGMNRAIAAVLVATSITAITTIATTVAAQDESEPPVSQPPFTSSGTVEFELIEQTFDLEPGGDIELTYRLTGDLATVAELAPATTTTTSTTTTTPPTTAPPTVPPTTVVDADPATDDPATVTPTTTPSTDAPPVTEAPTTTVLPPVPLTIRVLNYEPLDEPSDLAGRLGSNPRTDRFRSTSLIDGVDFLDARALIDVEGDDVATMRISVPTDADPSVAERLEFEDDGVHPILVQLRVNDQVVARHGTVIERRSSPVLAPPPLDLSMIASIDDPGPTADASAFADAADQLDDLLGVASVVDASITLDIPPSVARAAVERDVLRDDVDDILANEEVLAFPATPFDVSSAAAVDRVDAFVRQLSAGETDMRDLFGVFVVRDVWLATKPLSAEGAQVLSDLAVRYLAMPVSVYESTVANTDPGGDVTEPPTLDRFVELDLPDGSTIPILLIDDEFGSTFDERRTEEILAEQTATEWALETVAGWRLAQYAAPGTRGRDRLSRLIGTPDPATFDPTLLQALESFAKRTEAIRFTNASVVASVTDSQEQPGAALPETAGPSLEARLDRIARVEADLADTSSMLPDGDDRSADWARRLDSFVSTAFDDDAVNAELDGLVDEAARIRGAVVAPDPITFTLTGREEQQIEIRIGNELDEALIVKLRLSSPRLSFPDGDMLVTLTPDDITVVDVAVKARSNGTSAVTVEILTPDAERPLIEPVRLTSRVNSLTGIGQLLTAAFVLILASWWISHWRSRRRERDDDDAATDDSGGGDSGDGDSGGGDSGGDGPYGAPSAVDESSE